MNRRLKKILYNLLIIFFFFLALLSIFYGKSGGDIGMYFFMSIAFFIHFIVLGIMSIRTKGAAAWGFIGWLFGVIVSFIILLIINKQLENRGIEIIERRNSSLSLSHMPLRKIE